MLQTRRLGYFDNLEKFQKTDNPQNCFSCFRCVVNRKGYFDKFQHKKHTKSHNWSRIIFHSWNMLQTRTLVQIRLPPDPEKLWLLGVKERVHQVFLTFELHKFDIFWNLNLGGPPLPSNSSESTDFSTLKRAPFKVI